MHFAKLRWLNSFSRQLMAASAGGVLFMVGLLVAGLLTLFLFKGNLFEEVGVSEYAETLGEAMEFDAAGRPTRVALPEMAWLFESLAGEVTYRVLDDAGTVRLSSEPGAPALTAAGKPLELGDYNFLFERNGIPMHGATEIVERDGRIWYVQFATSDRLSAMLRSYIGEPLFSRSAAIFFAVALLVYFVVMRYTLRLILKPLNDASAIAAGISPRNLGTRLQVRGAPREMQPLVENFNAALERLETNYRLQQEFLTSAAHELKTPLALIRGQIEVGIDESNRHYILQDVSRMGRQVQQLLHLAEASELQNYTFAAVDAKSLVAEVTNYLERLARQHDVSVSVDVKPDTTYARADRGALFTLLKNLLENAIQHSPAGGVVQVHADSSVITVRDAGPGVPDEDLPKLFTRFWRGAHRRDLGAGLGLPICREIAAAHGWGIGVRREESGLAFELRVVD
jgi:two-component system, OmpR family, sensor histidine kinase QseC